MKTSVNAALIRELNLKGYRGKKIAGWLATMHEEKATKDTLGFVEGKGEKAIFIEIHPRWYLGGGAECVRLRACPLIIAVAEQVATGSVGAHPAWLSFEGLPPLAEVREQLDAQLKKLVAELPEAKVVRHAFHPHLRVKGPEKGSPGQSEELTP